MTTLSREKLGDVKPARQVWLRRPHDTNFWSEPEVRQDQLRHYAGYCIGLSLMGACLEARTHGGVGKHIAMCESMLKVEELFQC